MQAVDFEYDGRLLSDIGMEIVQFDSGSGFDITTAGSTLTFDTISTRGGKVFPLVATHYDEVFTATIGICKPDGATITTNEYRFILHWLNKKQFKKLVLITDEYERINFYGTFNIEKVEHRGRLIGFTLSFTSNAPFGWGDQVTDTFSLTTSSSHIINDNSDEYGEIPFDSFIITCNGSGTLKIENHYNHRITIISDCVDNEVITIDGKTLTVKSSTGRNVYNSFNFVYPMLSATVDIDKLLGLNLATNLVTMSGDLITTIGGNSIVVGAKVNLFTSTLPCTIATTHTPIRKVVF